MRILSTSKIQNEVAKHKNNAMHMSGHEQEQGAQHKNNANEAAKHKNDAK